MINVNITVDEAWNKWATPMKLELRSFNCNLSFPKLPTASVW